jgi:cytochrome c oxidase cbb3-type subunit 3
MNMLHATHMKKVLLAFASIMLTNVMAFAQTAATTTVPPAAAKPSVYQSPVFYALALVAILLLIFIIQLGGVVSAVAKNYTKGDKSMWDKMKMIIVLICASVLSGSDALAQTPATTPAAAPVAPQNNNLLDFLHHGFGLNAINALVVIILVELFVVLYLVRMIRLFTHQEKELAPLTERQPSASVFWDKFNKSVAVEQEAAVLTDHDYDGIRELDNSLPPWWKYGFYFTIVWGFAYYIYFHASNGPSSAQEYKTQMDEGAAMVAEYRAKAKNLVDETNVVLMTEASDLAAGKSIFTQYCAVCHRPDAGGQVGPNLTDDNWLHGGDIKDLFKTIKLGVQGKGMKSWQQELSPMMMAQVASYVKSLRGTKPENPKAPEGPIWMPPTEKLDSTTIVTTDTLVTPIDSITVAGI